MVHKVNSNHWNKCNNQYGQGLTEYLILLLLVAVVSITAAKTLGSTVKEKIQLARKHIKQEVTLK